MTSATLDPSTENISELKSRWAQLRETEPKLRIRDAAAKLGVTEVKLLATNIGETVTRLEGNFQELLRRLPAVGHVMCLTRNEHIVHERHGEFQKVEFHGPVMGLVLGPDIDLRMFMNKWAFAYSVVEPRGGDTMRSVQFFEKDGTAIHKIYLQDEGGNLEAWESLMADFTAADQTPGQTVEPSQPAAPDQPDENVDVPGFQAAWQALQDTHEFFGIQRKFRVGRLQAMRLAPEGFATRVQKDSLRKVLTTASEQDAEIMIFVGNNGLIQIHTGPVKKIVDFGDWINVLDPKFNLHARETAIDQCWVVKKPTRDGHVTSLELFAADGENIAMLFGKRKPGEPELEQWRNILASLEPYQA